MNGGEHLRSVQGSEVASPNVLIRKTWSKWTRVHGYVGNLCVHLVRRVREREPYFRRRVFADLHDTRLRRYTYLLLQSFHLAGYQIVLRHNHHLFRRTDEYIDLIFRIPGLRIALRKPRDASSWLYLTDRPCSAAERSHEPAWWKVINLNIDAFSEEAREAGAEHIPPQMHPLIYARELYSAIPDLRRRARTMRALFAGNTDPKAYSSFESTIFGGIPRHELLAHARRHLSDEELSEVEPVGAVTEGIGQFQRRLVILRGKVVIDQWLDVLSQADFFLVAPGVRTPFCHSIVEAMAVGTVPVLQHPDVLAPGLEDGKNCIVFRGRRDFSQRIRSVLSMDSETVAGLRRRAADYYDEHLAPSTLAQRIDTYPGRHLEAFMIAGSASVLVRKERLR